jgi:hypothetical protein
MTTRFRRIATTLCLGTVVILMPGAVGEARCDSRAPASTAVQAVLLSVTTDVLSGDVSISARGAAGTPQTFIVEAGGIPRGLEGVVGTVKRPGGEPKPGDTIRVTAWTGANPMPATVIEVRDGSPCTDCRAFGDRARGYRVWLVRTYFDMWRPTPRERALCRATAEVLAQHAVLGNERLGLWIRGQMNDLLSFYLRPGSDRYAARFGGSPFGADAPIVRALVLKHPTEDVLVFGLPFLPRSWGDIPVSDRWNCFPTRIYLTGDPPRRIL